MMARFCFFFFFSSRRRHTRCGRDWSSDVCSSDLDELFGGSSGPGMVPASGQDDAGLATGRADAVVELIARQEGLQAALEIAQAILAGQEPGTTWQLIASRARRLLQADAAIVRTVGEDGTTLSLRAM